MLLASGQYCAKLQNSHTFYNVRENLCRNSKHLLVVLDVENKDKRIICENVHYFSKMSNEKETKCAYFLDSHMKLKQTTQ